jgi:hypothetical protein
MGGIRRSAEGLSSAAPGPNGGRQRVTAPNVPMRPRSRWPCRCVPSLQRHPQTGTDLVSNLADIVPAELRGAALLVLLP